MFQKERLIQKYTFLFLDMINIAIALVIANIIRFGSFKLFEGEDRNLYILFLSVELLACVLSNRLFDTDKKAFDRGWFKEFVTVAKLEMAVVIAGLLFLFFIKESSTFSRLQMAYFIVIFFLLSYFGHQMAKKIIMLYYKNSRSFNQIMLISTSDKVESVLKKYKENNNWYFKIAYIVLVDKNAKG